MPFIPHTEEDIEEMLLAIVNQDVTILTSLIQKIGTPPSDLDEAIVLRIVVLVEAITVQIEQPAFDVAGSILLRQDE